MRKPNYQISDLILNRHSPRALDGNVAKDEIMALFEAARWAPSSFNNQPWRFVYALRGSGYWDSFFGLMGDFNRRWAGNAAALVIVTSSRKFEYNGKPSRTHAFDAGAAWENLALEAHSRGLIAHAMEGFDYVKAVQVIGLPQDHEIHCMIAIGKPGNPDDLPEGIREKEQITGRKPLDEIVFEGKFS